jgi:hypothetical protein
MDTRASFVGFVLTRSIFVRLLRTGARAHAQARTPPRSLDFHAISVRLLHIRAHQFTRVRFSWDSARTSRVNAAVEIRHP